MSKGDAVQPRPDLVSLAAEEGGKQVLVNAAHHTIW